MLGLDAENARVKPFDIARVSSGSESVDGARPFAAQIQRAQASEIEMLEPIGLALAVKRVRCAGEVSRWSIGSDRPQLMRAHPPSVAAIADLGPRRRARRIASDV